MKKGILIIANGHRNYYRMAVVLAASVKSNEPSMPICLITDNEVTDPQLFDIVKKPTPESITQNGKTEYIKAKTFMYDLSPFDETIFLDADQIVIEGKKLLPVFDELKGIDFTMSNTGIAQESYWGDIQEVKNIYGDKPFWNFHSEFVYFKKSKEAKKFFDAAKKVYKEGKIKSAKRFANATMADELAFQSAAIITGIYPHKENWLPNFWFGRDAPNSRKYTYELTGYLTYSIGGDTVLRAVKENYNNLAKHYFAKLGLSNPFQVIDKRKFLPERITI